VKRVETRKDKWISLHRALGGGTTTEEMARAALSRHLFPELEERASLSMLAADWRKNANIQGEDGHLGAYRRVEYTLDDVGNQIEVERWIQRDLIDIHDWEFAVRDRMKGMQRDGTKLKRLRGAGLRDWPEEAPTLIKEIEAEFGFGIDDVAGEDVDDEE